MTQLTTARLSLRPVTGADAELLRDLDSDPEVMRYLNGGIPTSLETIETSILPRFLSYSRQAPWAGVWLAFDLASGAFVGWFSLRPEPEGSGSLGYRLQRAWWDRGMATEGATALLHHAFASTHLPRVFATTYEENAASRRVLEKLGMRLVRRFRPEAGEPTTFEPDAGEPWPGEDLEYAIDAAAWLASRPPPHTGGEAVS